MRILLTVLTLSILSSSAWAWDGERDEFDYETRASRQKAAQQKATGRNARQPKMHKYTGDVEGSYKPYKDEGGYSKYSNDGKGNIRFESKQKIHGTGTYKVKNFRRVDDQDQ